MNTYCSTTKRLLIFLWGAMIFLLQSCTVIDTQPGKSMDPAKTWALLPFQNHSTTPRAGEKVESILTTLLYTQGINHFIPYPTQSNDTDWPELDDRRQQEQALVWARDQNIFYAVIGSVEEWRYKAGVGGEPAVGLSIRIVEIGTGQTIWSASGARSGWSTESLTGTAQKLIRELLSTLEISET